MQRYFLKDKINDKFIFHEKDIHHIKNVMRYQKGDQIEVVWDNKVFLCSIDSIDPLNISVIKNIEEERENHLKLTIAISLVPEQKFDLILQKATELGVSKIIPLKTERSIVKIDNGKLNKKYQRWQTICKEASEQSKRTVIPQIEEISTLKEISTKDSKLKLICSLNDMTRPINEYLKEDIQEILIVIGPEGGFSRQEEKELMDNNFIPVSLGKRVLRVETAAIYVASIINYKYGG